MIKDKYSPKSLSIHSPQRTFGLGSNGGRSWHVVKQRQFTKTTPVVISMDVNRFLAWIALNVSEENATGTLN